jgi:hypothetical protein
MRKWGLFLRLFLTDEEKNEENKAFNPKQRISVGFVSFRGLKVAG